MSKPRVNIFWFRRDLRLYDNTGLNVCLKSDRPVLPIFIFDTNILEDLEDRDDARVTFIHDQLERINQSLKSKNSGLKVYHGDPQEIWEELTGTFDIGEVFTNRDYEPYARSRDKAIYEFLDLKKIPFNTYKDHVIFEKKEVVKEDGSPYVVFTPYSKVWKKRLQDNPCHVASDIMGLDNFYQFTAELPSLNDLGFERSRIEIPPNDLDEALISKYGETRDYPAIKGTSRLGIHLRFGTVSIRKVVQLAKSKNETFLNELIWREFYQTILFHFPKVVDNNFRSKYDHVEWRNNEEEFKAWCEGKTGYPIVDAGMRELNTTGHMHNRVRMIVASFLTKHLLIDWRWGEAYFARKLLDFELASNNGGWQWAAGTGTDAQPYFRIFNPESQTKKFDPELKYIKMWVPEFQELSYPKPIVDHKFARERCLDTFKEALEA
ncbi:FAD-binding domain-containing protein [Fulvivirga lutimaris]|uniref:FAD-binding domain-containing protein n=1 Tax=Fulvivirga lutimaris TaxID=1819566 RepID=UPI00162A06D5|nr:deoxyribodipyrimidine photo-lyase [Fulvivirga lutimaris]